MLCGGEPWSEALSSQSFGIPSPTCMFLSPLCFLPFGLTSHSRFGTRDTRCLRSWLKTPRSSTTRENHHGAVLPVSHLNLWGTSIAYLQSLYRKTGAMTARTPSLRALCPFHYSYCNSTARLSHEHNMTQDCATFVYCLFLTDFPFTARFGDQHLMHIRCFFF